MVIPDGRAAIASSQPPVVSWSVRAITSRPALAASPMTAAGVSVPSEAVEWVCRSMRRAHSLPTARRAAAVQWHVLIPGAIVRELRAR
jgi:flavin reductase (DIM6/NTAB) family NADH-FMN oxidoreductase RutF